MPAEAVRVEGLSKRYRIGAREGYRTFRETVMDAVTFPFRRIGSRPKAEHIWALRDISLQVEEGEVVGIIGRNGAGKTTLLKILSRITEPTGGRVVLRGRVASLLEVGTGFHPELTGRENIFLNGAILGMSRGGISRRFDEIVAFSEVERFLDTPVKRYSSGMYMRLAFAVAAHLEPEILLVDEVLAVGDAAFQKKCLGKMRQVRDLGRTVLFVSHNMQAVESLCSRTILLSGGHLLSEGNTRDVIARYYMETTAQDRLEGMGCLRIDREVLARNNRGGFMLRCVRAVDESGADAAFSRTGEPLTLQLVFSAEKCFQDVAFVIQFFTRSGTELIRLSTEPISGYPIRELHGQGHLTLMIEHFPLTADTYILDVAMALPFKKIIAEYRSVAFLTVSASNMYGGSVPLDSSRGYVVTPHTWRLCMDQGSADAR